MESGSAELAALLSTEGRENDGASCTEKRESSIIVGLFRRRAKRMRDYFSFRLRNKEDAEDAAQEVFLKLWRREDAGALREDASAYMYSTALSVASDAERHRTSRARERFVDMELDEIGQASPSQEEQLHWRQAMTHFVDCVKELPDLTRRIFVMHHVEGMHYPAIARELRISTRTVERHIADAFVEMQRRMGDYL